MLSDFLRCEVGCDNGEKLLFITLCQQVNNRGIYVVIVQHLRWFCAKVIDAEHIDTDEFTVCLMVVLAEVRNVLCIHNSDSVCVFVVWFGNMQSIQQLFFLPNE